MICLLGTDKENKAVFADVLYGHAHIFNTCINTKSNIDFKEIVEENLEDPMLAYDYCMGWDCKPSELVDKYLEAYSEEEILSSDFSIETQKDTYFFFEQETLNLEDVKNIFNQSVIDAIKNNQNHALKHVNIIKEEEKFLEEQEWLLKNVIKECGDAQMEKKCKNDN